MSIQQSSKHSESDCTKMCSFKCKNYFQHSEIHTLCEAGRNWDQARKDQVYIYNSPRINPKISEHFKLLFSLPLFSLFFNSWERKQAKFIDNLLSHYPIFPIRENKNYTIIRKSIKINQLFCSVANQN